MFYDSRKTLVKLAKNLSKIKGYLYNTIWIMGDKLTTLGVGFLVTVLIARHLGPQDFGLFSYAISTVAIFTAAGHMGLSGLVVREIVKKPEERGIILGTTLTLKMLGMLIGYAALMVYAWSYEGAGSTEFYLLLIAGLILFFRPFDIIDFWFQAFIQAKYTTISRLSGVVFGSALKLALVFFSATVYYFVFANLIQSIAVACFLLYAYKLKSNIKIAEWKFNLKKAKELFSQGWMVYLGSIFAVIYLKVDQVMLRWFDGAETVGIYAVAAQLSEAWYFIPTAIVATFFPKLISLREKSEAAFNKRFQQLLDLLFTLAFGVALIVTFSADSLVDIFFGKHYEQSASVLVIHIWAAVFIFMRAAFSRWILIENALKFSLITQGAGASINILLNFFFIPRFGAIGAAYATLTSYAFASFFVLAFYSKTRPIFFMMAKSLFVFLRYLTPKRKHEINY